MAYVLLFTVPDRKAGVKKNSGSANGICVPLHCARQGAGVKKYTGSANGLCVQQIFCQCQYQNVYTFTETSVLQWKSKLKNAWGQ